MISFTAYMTLSKILFILIFILPIIIPLIPGFIKSFDKWIINVPLWIFLIIKVCMFNIWIRKLRLSFHTLISII